MRNDYGKRYCEFVKNKSGCHLDPRGCWERIITAALPSEGSQARISCGTRLLDNYRECLEGCNGEFATGAINIYTLIGRADDCANAAEGAVKACDAGAIDPPNKPTLAALPTSRLPGSESSPRTGDPIAKISGTWEFGRVISATERQVICHLTLTRERVEKIGGYKISGNRHPNESFWGLEGENTIWFKHADGKITSKLTRREDDYWEGEYIEHKDAPVRGKKLNHYIKRVKK